ncbi:MAG: hypothetical protein AAGD10_10980 [Myxococcota bacterium]
MSRRSRDRAIREGLRKLKAKPGWDPSSTTSASPEDQLRTLAQSERTDASYQKADACQACQAERRSTGDDTALCAQHFAEAMGL